MAKLVEEPVLRRDRDGAFELPPAQFIAHPVRALLDRNVEQKNTTSSGCKTQIGTTGTVTPPCTRAQTADALRVNTGTHQVQGCLNDCHQR